MSAVTPVTPYPDGVVCAPRAGTLYDVLELILDRGMVIDIFVRISLVGIEVLKIDARIVVASVDTYLRFAEACHRLDLERDSDTVSVPELFGMGGGDGGGGMAKEFGKKAVKKAGKKAVSAAGEKAKKALGADDDEEEEDEEAGNSSHRSSRSRSRRREEAEA